jgi:hypothetical protein
VSVAAPALLLIGLSAWSFAPLWAGGRTALRADNYLHGAVQVWLAERLAAGSFPFWVEESALGHPLYAEATNAILSPLNLVALAFLPGSIAHDALVILHGAILALGTFAFARAFGLERSLALVAATLAAFSPAGLGLAANFTWLQGVAWSAVVFAAFERFLARPLVRLPLPLAIATALLLVAGYPPLAHATFLFLGLVLLGRIALAPRRRPLATGVAFALALVVGAALASFQLVPFLELVAQSNRAEQVEFRAQIPITASLLGLWLSSDVSLYHSSVWIGEGLASPLAWCALALLPLARDPRAVLYLLLSLLFLTASAGPGNPVYDFLARVVPGVDRLRHTYSFSWVVVPPLAVAVAAIAGRARWRGASRVARAAAVVTAALSLTLGWASTHSISWKPYYAIVLAVAFGATAALVVWGMLAPTARWRGPALAAVVLAQTALLAPRYNQFPERGIAQRPSRLAELLAARRETNDTGRVATHPMPLHAARRRTFLRRPLLDPPAQRGMAYCRAVLCPSHNLPEGVSHIDAFNSVPLGRRELVQPLLEQELRGRSTLAPGARLLDRLDVRFVTVAEAARPEAAPADFELILRDESDAFAVLENHFARGPWFRSEDVIAVQDRESALRTLEQEGGRSVVEALPQPDWPRPVRALVEALPWAHETVHLRARTAGTAAGWLYVPSPVFPGWRARVDGREAPIHAADVVAKAVPVPAGEHEVELAFLPIGFHLGLLASGASVLVVAALGLRAVRERRGEDAISASR